MGNGLLYHKILVLSSKKKIYIYIYNKYKVNNCYCGKKIDYVLAIILNTQLLEVHDTGFIQMSRPCAKTEGKGSLLLSTANLFKYIKFGINRKRVNGKYVYESKSKPFIADMLNAFDCSMILSSNIFYLLIFRLLYKHLPD